MKLLYLAGPIGANDAGRFDRIHAAMEIAARLSRIPGVVVFVPHLCHYWDERHPRTYREWMDYDAAWLEVCHGLFRMDGVSPGADEEVSRMSRFGRPIFVDEDAVAAWALS